MESYVGLDVHSKNIVYLVQDEKGQTVRQGKVETSVAGLTEMIRQAHLRPSTPIALETGTQAKWVYQQLVVLGMAPVVVDAGEVRRKARRVGQKTDRRDAFEICDGLRRDIYTCRIWVPDAGIERLRKVLSRRRHFVRMSTQQINAAKYVLRSEAIATSGLSLTTQAAWARLLAREDISAVAAHVRMHADSWQLAREQVEQLEAELLDALRPYRQILDLLTTLPGVGLITAATYLAVLGTPDRFAHAGHVVSYIGMAPSTYDTGETQRHGRITKRGSSPLRAMLCEAAQHANKVHHPLHPYFARVAAKHGYKKAVIAVAQRMARILYQMWCKQERFDVRQLNVVRAPKTIAKSVVYRIRKPKEAVRTA